ncbi:hypothetical protein ACL9RI_08740 [Janthinobacterium sp. Mn2066]|uniref:hypothetical protein n=1 Tax=Janthinobacterium sp. Mn2066 TaxID=3395264 RepID=UPI003BBE3BEF
MQMKTIRLAGFLACAALLVACAGIQGGAKPVSAMPGPASASPPGLNNDVAATWYNPPGEFDGICLTQFKDGRLRFDGGFTFFNPGSWTYDAASSELRLTLHPTTILAQGHGDVSLHQNLLRLDAARNMLVYRVKADTKSIGLGGFIFYRDLPCPAGQSSS